MKVIVFGATGMVGQGVLRECLLDPEVERVLVITRHPTGQQDPKLRELVHQDFLDYSSIESELADYDACFFCLGISSVGMNEADYRRITHDFAVAAAQTLVRRNPRMTFVYVSGGGADSSERGRIMWARVKGQAENAILAMPFAGKYVFRPGIIQPLHGIKSRTRGHRVLYAIFRPLFPLLKTVFPKHVTTTERVGRAMLKAVKQGAGKPVLGNPDINALAAA
jgi:uncharacterized protein YbjT (DUF2867 family)